MPRFGAVVTAMITPFDENDVVDLDVAADLARWLVDHGTEGLVLAGTTGESSVLDDREKLDLWQAVAEAVDVPVIAGTGSNDTAHTVALTRAAGDLDVAGVIVVTPYYNRPGPAGIDGHFRAAAEATDLPVLLYDIPVRTGRKVPTDVLVRLVREVPNIVGVKDATGNPAETGRLVAELPESADVYSGDDSLTLPLLAVGAVGVVGVATHWAGPQFKEMVTAYEKGDVVRAREVNASLYESYDFETGPEYPNPIPTKAMMRALGFGVGQCRAPMGLAPDSLEDLARQVYGNLTRG